MEENNLLDEFLKTMTKPVIVFGKRAGNFLPARHERARESKG